MVDLSTEIKKLNGRTLYSLAQRRPFDIVSVDVYEVEIYVRSTGKKRRVPMTEIACAWDILRRAGRITRGEIEERCSPRNPVYVAAILAELPGVSCESKPIITLFRLEQR